jgi:sigma-E factor negative regulatory protein RseC
MIESQARVLAVEPDHVWVEAERRSACSHCSDSAGCGMSAVGELFGTRTMRLRLPGVPDVHPGDVVTIGLPEGQLLTVALSAYLLPLLALIGAVVLATLLDLGQGMQAAAGLAGLAAGLWLAGRRAAARQAYGRGQPVIVGVAHGRAQPPLCQTQTTGANHE